MKFVQVKLPYVAIQYGGPVCACAQQIWQFCSAVSYLKAFKVYKYSEET